MGCPRLLQAHVLQGLRRAIAIALAVADQFADRTALKDLKRANLEGALADAQGGVFRITDGGGLDHALCVWIGDGVSVGVSCV